MKSPDPLPEAKETDLPSIIQPVAQRILRAIRGSDKPPVVDKAKVSTI